MEYFFTIFIKHWIASYNLTDLSIISVNCLKKYAIESITRRRIYFEWIKKEIHSDVYLRRLVRDEVIAWVLRVLLTSIQKYSVEKHMNYSFSLKSLVDEVHCMYSLYRHIYNQNPIINIHSLILTWNCICHLNSSTKHHTKLCFAHSTSST